MIKGMHAMFYSSDANALRAFFRDKLGFSSTDVGNGWLIFDIADAEIGCHPAESQESAPPGTYDISFYCDDLPKTVSELKAKGVQFITQISDEGYGLVTRFKMPGGCEAQLYQPHYRRNPEPSAR